MKHIHIIIPIVLLFAACGNPNDAFDMLSPKVEIAADTLETARNSTIRLSATLTDESGLESCTLEYPAWNIKQEIKLAALDFPKKYQFTAEITIPADAESEWLENYQKHDGSIFKITQTYHRISLTVYDRALNKNTVYFYIKSIE